MPQAETEFDQYDTEYQNLVEESMSFSGMSHSYVTEAKVDLIVAIAERRFGNLESRHILDVGCGIGLTDSFLLDRPWKVSGTDVSAKSIEQAKLRNPQIDYVVGEENRLPFDDELFDLCFTICVIHHVSPAGWTNFLCEMRRILKPKGVAIVIEHNPFNPLTRLVVNRCPFDADAVLLSKRTLTKHLQAAKLKPLSSNYFLFTPWNKLKCIDRLFSWFPMGAQYCVAATR